MTDREALEQLLERFGLSPGDTGKAANWAEHGAVSLMANHGGVEGYDEFIAVFQFDADGKFTSLHIWE